MLNKIIRKSCFGISIVLAATSFAMAATYPSKPIRLIVPYPAGDSTDVLARTVGEELGTELGQPVVVENRPGASGVIAAQSVAKMPADGHNLLITVSSHVIMGKTMPKLPYDPMTDFVPIAPVAMTDWLLLARPDLPFDSVNKLNDYAEENPEKINFGSLGTVGMGRISYEIYRTQSGKEFTRIPYQGSVDLLTALSAGEVDVGLDVVSTFLPHILDGRVKALAITGDSRIPALPDVPTFAEAGMKEYEMSMWYGIFAPKGVPQEIVDQLSNKVKEILQKPSVANKLKAQELSPYILSNDEFKKLVWDDHNRLAKIIEANDIRLK